jgi:hypothetical protein
MEVIMRIIDKNVPSQVRPFEKEVERRYSAGGGRLISQHINSMLEAAYREHRTNRPLVGLRVT